MSVPRVLQEPLVVHQLADYLLGVSYTPRGGDWWDYLRLSVVHRDLAAIALTETHLVRLARAYQPSEQRMRWAFEDALRRNGVGRL